MPEEVLTWQPIMLPPNKLRFDGMLTRFRCVQIESFNDWRGRECRKFVLVLGGDATKIAPPKGTLDQPPGEIS